MTLPYCLTVATEGILSYQTAGICVVFEVFRQRTFDRIARSILFQTQREFNIEDVARLITGNLVLQVYMITAFAW